MPLHIGTSSVSALAIGSASVDKAYLGATEVFSPGGGAATTLDTALVMDRSYEQDSVNYDDYVLSSDGTRCVILDSDGTLRERTLSTAFDPSSTAGSDTDTLDVTGLTSYVQAEGILLNKAGDQLGLFYERSSSLMNLAVYTSSGGDATDLSSLSLDVVITLDLGTNDPTQISTGQLNSDGSSLYTFDQGLDRIQRWDLGTADDLTTVPRSADSETAALSGLRGGIIIPDENRVYMTNGKRIAEYQFTTPGDLSEITQLADLDVWCRTETTNVNIEVRMHWIDSDSKLLIIWRGVNTGTTNKTMVTVYDCTQTTITDIDVIKAAFNLVGGADSAYTSAMNTLITDAKSDGWWSKIETFLVMAVPFGLENVTDWKNNVNSFSGSVSQRIDLEGALTWNDRESLEGASTSNYIEFLNENVNSINSNRTIGFYVKNAPADLGYLYGANATGGAVEMRQYFGSWRLTIAATTDDASGVASDQLVTARWGAASGGRPGDIFIDGSSAKTLTSNSTTVSGTERLYVFCRNFRGSPNTPTGSGTELSLFFLADSGTLIDGTDCGNINTRFETFLTAVAP